MNVVDALLFTKSHVNSVVISTLEILKIQEKMEPHFQDVAQKVMNNNNLDSFAAHFANTFTQKGSLQKCRDVISFKIIFTVNPVG